MNPNQSNRGIIRETGAKPVSVFYCHIIAFDCQAVVHLSGRPLHQPLTEPAVMPFTSDFWAIKMNSAVGMVDSVIAAAMFPHSTA